MSDNYGSSSLSLDERDELKRQIERARMRQLGIHLVETKEPTPEEIAETDYCSELSQKILNHELDASKFWNLTTAS